MAVNCCVCPCAVVAAAGVMASAAEIVATVDVTWPLPSVAVAVMEHEAGLDGVWYRPVVAPMVPQDAVHVDATLDVNCCCVPAGKVGLRGVMVREVVDPGAAIVS